MPVSIIDVFSISAILLIIFALLFPPSRADPYQFKGYTDDELLAWCEYADPKYLGDAKAIIATAFGIMAADVTLVDEFANRQVFFSNKIKREAYLITA